MKSQSIQANEFAGSTSKRLSTGAEISAINDLLRATDREIGPANLTKRYVEDQSNILDSNF
jgi:hypothetical protein